MYKAIMIIIELSGLFFLAKIYSGYPKTVLQQQYKKGLFAFLMAFLYLSIFLLTMIIWFKQPIEEALIISASSFWEIGFLTFIILWIQSKKKSGKVLLDIQSIPNKFAFVALAIYFSVVGLGSALSHIWATHYGLYIAISFWASLITWSLVMATSRLQICDSGLMVYCILRRWEKIESFDFQRDERAYILKLKYKGRLPALLRNDTLKIPTKKKLEIESSLGFHMKNRA